MGPCETSTDGTACYFGSLSKYLALDLAPACRRHAFAWEENTPSAGISRFALELLAISACLAVRVRGICGGVDLGRIVREAYCRSDPAHKSR